MIEQNKTTNKINKIVLAKITKVGKTYFEIITSEKENGVVYINDVSDYFVKNLNDIVKINNILYLVVTGQEKNRLVCSFKKNRSDFLRKPFDFSLNESTEESFKNLFNFTMEEFKKWKE